MRAGPIKKIRHHPQVAAAATEVSGGSEHLLPLLQQVQHVEGQLSSETLGATADTLGLPDAQVHGVASFYALLSLQPQGQPVVRVCDGPVCSMRGAAAARVRLEETASACGGQVTRCSCLGLCDRAPAALIGLEPCGPLDQVPPQAVWAGWRGASPSYALPQPGEYRAAMERVGRIDPLSIDDALRHGAYRMLRDALAQPPGRIIDAIEAARLRGRGGAGFFAHAKWRSVAAQPARPKWVVCNADESEPATFKDRVLMESDPHLLLESLALAGYAAGADQAIIYIRGEYEAAARRLEVAIGQAAEAGWLGDNIQCSGWSFHVHVHRGAGAYICGEETALLESLEGRRGEPRVRPPFPATHGYRGQPTLVQNVETLCCVPLILARGSSWFQQVGTPGSAGTKVFTISGQVNRPCAFEAPLGITLRQAIDNFAGGMRDGRPLQFVVVGGAAGTLVPPALLDVPLDYDSMRHGVLLGSGAIIVADDSVTIPRMLHWLLWFFEQESCGKCTPCRIGTRQARQILDRIAAGRTDSNDLPRLRELAQMLGNTSLCGLGQSAAWPIQSALVHFGPALCPAS
jgi:NADH:ubiquinone oxidoreductase subunit F (NADH-binding)/NADH:ubiquinone oxidoreductase subunit E